MTTMEKPVDNIKKRSRVTRACDICRRKKIKCDIDKKQPCSSCEQYHSLCSFSPNPTAHYDGPKGYIESLEIRLRKMEHLLKEVNSGEDGDNESAHNESSDENAEGNEENCRQKRSKNTHESSTDVTSEYQSKHTNILKDIISDELLNELAERFFVQGPSILPIINKESYYQSYNNGTIEPLLVCAVCLFEIWIIPPTNSIYEKHKVDRDVLLKEFMNKENELLRTAMLDATIENIQGLLILCHQPSYTTTVNSFSLKVGLAIRMCLDLGLHKPLDTIPYSKKSSEIGKRLWYSAYTMDRWACSVFGRPLAIADADFHLELPYHPKLQKYILKKSTQQQDSNNNKSSDDDDHENDDEDNYDDGKDDMENFYFILLIKLSAILGEIQRRIYSPRAKTKLDASPTTNYIVQSLQSLLLEWYEQVPIFARITLEDVAKLQLISTNEKDAILRTTRWQIGSQLMLCYYAVTIILHRPFIVAENELLYNPESAKICSEAAMQGVEIGRHLDCASYLRFGYNIGTFVLTVCVFIHAYNCCNSEDPNLVQISREYLKHSLDCYNRLEDLPTAVGIRTHLYSLIPVLGIKGILPDNVESSSTQNKNNNDNNNNNSNNKNNEYKSNINKNKTYNSKNTKDNKSSPTTTTIITEIKDREENRTNIENSPPSLSSTLPIQSNINYQLPETITQLQYMQRVLFSPANTIPYVNNNNNNNNFNANKNNIPKSSNDTTTSVLPSELNDAMLLSSISLSANSQQNHSQDAWQQFFLNNVNNDPDTMNICSNLNQGLFGFSNNQN
ncbi:unnamed protein product [Cunninghamella blakesleeana]